MVTCNINTLSFATGLLECFLLVHGIGVFSSIQSVLTDDYGFYEELSASEQSILFSKLYTTMAVTLNFTKIITGILIDTKGVWVTRVFTTIFSSIGLVCILAATPDRDYLIWIGYPLFYGVSLGYVFSQLVLLKMYPEQRGILIALLGAANNAVFFLYVLYKEYLQNWFFVILLFIQPLSLFRTFLLTPKSNDPFCEGPNGGSATANTTAPIAAQARLGWKTKNDPFTVKPENEETGGFVFLLKNLFRYSNLIMYGWVFCGYFRMGSFMANQEGWLNWVVSENGTSNMTDYEHELVSEYTTNWLYANLFGILIQPLCGFLLDKVIRTVAQKYNYNPGLATIMVTPFAMVVCSLLWVLQSYLMTIKSIGWVTWAVYIVYVFQRLNVSVSNLYVLSNNGSQFSGRVLAVISCLTIVTSLLQPLVTNSVVEHDNDYGLMNARIAWLSAGSLVFAVMMYFEKYVKSLDFICAANNKQ